jgi:hypothetical protein
MGDRIGRGVGDWVGGSISAQRHRDQEGDQEEEERVE